MAFPLPQRTQSNTRAEHLSDHNTMHEAFDYIKGFINHGANASTARPDYFASVEWYGSVEPVNAIDGDTWIDTSV